MLYLLIFFFSVTAHAADLTFRFTADPATLDWNLARSSHETYVIMNIMEGLVEEGPDLKPRPALAEKWEISADGKTYTFHLRSGVKWSDGKPLKASEFVDSWLRLLSPRTQSPYASFLYAVENAEAYHTGKIKSTAAVGVKAVSDLIFQIKLARPVSYFLHLPTFWVTFPIRLDLIKKHGSEWAAPGKIATLGPYLLTSWERGKKVGLTRNSNYYGDPLNRSPNPDTVDAIIEPSDQKARELFTTGKIDFLLDATTEDLLRAKDQPQVESFRVEKFPYLATYYLGFNIKSGPLKDAKIRRAIALGVDRNGIPAALQGGQMVAPCWIPPGIDGHHEASHLTGTLYDAQGTLSGAGYVEGRRFPKLSLLVEKFDGAEAISQFIEKSLHEKLGIEVESKIGAPGEFQKTLASGKAMLFIGHWGADFPDAENFLEVFSSSSGTNYTGWKSAKFDELLKEAREAKEPGKRMAAFQAAEDVLIQQDTVILPLFYKKNLVLLGKRIQDFQISPLNYLFLKTLSLKKSAQTEPVQSPTPR